MKAEELKLSRVDFPKVSSLDNLEVGRIYTTTSHSILKPLKYNRGDKHGYLPERVAAITRMIDNEVFMFKIVHVLINLKGKVIDGNNRLKALRDKGLPVNFIITAEPKFNLEDESEILNNVSELNSINSAWFDLDSYLSALHFNEPTAKAIESTKKLIFKTHAGLEDMFTPSRIIVLAKKDKTGLSSKKQSRREYCSKETAEIINSGKFKDLVGFICNVLDFVKVDNDSITPWFVVRQLMPLIWKYDTSLNVVLSNLKKKGFKNMENTKMPAIKARVISIMKMGNI